MKFWGPSHFPLLPFSLLVSLSSSTVLSSSPWQQWKDTSFLFSLFLQFPPSQSKHISLASPLVSKAISLPSLPSFLLSIQINKLFSYLMANDWLHIWHIHCSTCRSRHVNKSVLDWICVNVRRFVLLFKHIWLIGSVYRHDPLLVILSIQTKGRGNRSHRV